jgi:hypothetical protein
MPKMTPQEGSNGFKETIRQMVHEALRPRFREDPEVQLLRVHTKRFRDHLVVRTRKTDVVRTPWNDD